MNKQTLQYVINQKTLENFDRVAQEPHFLDEEILQEKPRRDPRGNKDRDLRKLSKKDRWDD